MLTINYKNPANPVKDSPDTWKIGESTPFHIPIDEISNIDIDGDELNYVIKMFCDPLTLTIPFYKDGHVRKNVTIYGDLAKNIVANL